jgi:LEA14-like dessication related protein
MIFKPLLKLFAAASLLVLISCNKPKGLEFTGFQKFNVEPLSFVNSRISLGIGVFNPNNFDVKVDHVDADISLAGKSIGSYQLDSTVYLKANQPFVMPVQLVVKNGTLISNILGIVAGDSIPYSLSGKVKAGRKIATAEIPFSYSGHLTQKDFNLSP